MERVSRNVGKCLTENKLKNFDTEVEKYAEFVLMPQHAHQPSHMSQVEHSVVRVDPKIYAGSILYGINTEDGTLTWLGEIIDSSD